MSPWRRMSVIRNPGWFGEQGMPVNSGWPSSMVRRPPATASSRARVPGVVTAVGVLTGSP